MSQQREVLVDVMIDPFGGGDYDGYDEFEALQKAIPELLLPAGCSAIIRRAHCMNEQTNADLVVYDFGGMMPGSDDLIASNARAFGRFLQAHPNALGVVISRFTYSRMRFEFIDAGMIPEDDDFLPSSIYAEDDIKTPFENLIVTTFTVDFGFQSESDIEKIQAWFKEKKR